MKTLLVIAMVVASAGVAAAQPSMTPPSTVPAAAPPPPPPPGAPLGPTTAATAPQRHGLFAGADLGIGAMSSSNGSYTACSGCSSSSSAAIGLEAGWMFSPRAAIVVGLSLDAKNGSPSGVSPQVTHGETALLIGGAYWTSPKLFLEGDIGKSQLGDTRSDGSSTQYDSGTALAGAVGYELISGRHFALDARFRVMGVSYKTISDTVLTPTLALGLRWFSVR
jgi:hypothetical protein